MAKLILILASCAVLAHLSTSAVIYTRWGRNVCGAGSKVLYTGFMAKGHYDHAGSGANYVCAHSKPKYENFVAGAQDNSAWIYGVEYELWNGYTDNLPFSYANNGGADIAQSDAVCVVCYNAKASAQHMVVGRPDCPSSDMKLEYKGYLASERHLHHRGEFICLDGAPEVRPGSQANLDGGLLYAVQGACGSLPCPPYVDAYELTCAVCTI